MNKKVIYTIVSLLILIVIVFGTFKLTKNNDIKINAKILNDFIDAKLTTEKGGIHTNYIDNEEIEELAKGHQILSESMGLIMLNQVYKDNEKAFKQSHTYIERFMEMSSGLYRWRIREDETLTNQSNATIDDLRIARAYYLAHEKWGDERYLNLSLIISQGLLDTSIKDNYLLNSQGEESIIDLSYLDIKTMSYLFNSHRKWLDIRRQSLKIIRNGYISDEFPFYFKTYDLENKSYIKQEEINMIDSLLVVLHLSEESMVNNTTIEWIENKLNEGTIYGRYQYGSWEPVDELQSTAVYAIIMRIGANLNNDTIIERARERMENYQILDKESELYGAFGNKENLEVFSFDQLQALLAYREVVR